MYCSLHDGINSGISKSIALFLRVWDGGAFPFLQIKDLQSYLTPQECFTVYIIENNATPSPLNNFHGLNPTVNYP